MTDTRCETPDAAIEIRGLVKRFGRVRALDGLDLLVRRGEVFGLLGPNGAGKTTTLKILAGLVRPDSGSVSVFGMDARAHRVEIAARCGMMIDEPGLHPNLSGRRNLELFGRLSGLSGDRLVLAVGGALELAALGRAAERPVRTYSTGMRRRTGIAVAMLGEPELLVLDEPTSGLDPESVLRLRAAMNRAVESRRATFLVSSHNLPEMETVCNRVGFASGGRVIACGAPHEFARRGRCVHMIRVSDPAAASLVLAGAAKRDFKGPWIEIEADERSLSEAVGALLGADLLVHEIRPAMSTLEDAFMRLASEAACAPGGRT